MPEWPSAPGINVLTLQYHANNGVYVTEFEGIMHRGTHMDAPLHVTENTPTLTGYPIWRFFGTGVAVSIPKGKWGVITADDLAGMQVVREWSWSDAQFTGAALGLVALLWLGFLALRWVARGFASHAT